MDGLLKVAVLLSTVDQMSRIVDNATAHAQKKLVDLSKSSINEGIGLISTGIAISKSLAPAVEAYSKLEDAQIDLETSMRSASGEIDNNFQKISSLAEDLGNALPGTTADFYALFQTMMNNGVKSQNILSGVGIAAAHLAVDLKMPYQAAGQFAARMKEATGVADEEMTNFMDTISRVNSLGIGTDEMQYAFSRSAGTLKSLGLQGLEASNQMAVLYATLIRSGQSGETAATSFNSITQTLLDPKKFSSIQEEAHKLGVSFKFFENGKFLGVENMVSQFGKLNGMDSTKTASLIKAVTGGGQDAQALSILIQQGASGYRKMQAELQSKASLSDKVKMKLGTLSAVWEATTGSMENMLAALGAGLAPILKPLAAMIGLIAGKVKDFLSANPELAKFITMVISLTGVFLTLLGAVKIIQGIRIAMQLLNLTMMQNPFILIASLAILAISLIYAKWGSISSYFSKIWTNIKQSLARFGQWVYNLFMNYTPHGLIIKHWDKIPGYFHSLLTTAKNIFMNRLNWLFNLPSVFAKTGSNIINSLINGIKSGINKPVELIKNMLGKVMALFPFSPAKEGPLKNIPRIRLVQTIADSVKPAPLVNAVKKVTGDAYDVMNKQPGAPAGLQPSAMAGGRNMSAYFTINLNGSASKADAVMVAAECKKQFREWMKNYNSQQTRVRLA